MIGLAAIRTKQAMDRLAAELRVAWPPGYHPLSPRFGPPARLLLQALLSRRHLPVTLAPDDPRVRIMLWPDAASTRRRGVDVCLWAIEHAAGIHYAERRPMQSLDEYRYRRLPITADCSETATAVCWAAGARDPNGLGYHGYGNTDTLLAHCPHIPQREAKPMDLVVWGRAPGSHHVAILIEPGTIGDPLCCSHGSEIGPLRLRVSQESAYHQGDAITYLRTVNG